MSRVAVVGAGVAGISAAISASESGSVALFEAAESVPPPKSSWPELILGRTTAEVTVRKLEALGVSLRLGTRVKAAGPGCSLSTSSGREEFDALVWATGSSFMPDSVPGREKRCVHILSQPDSFSLLGREAREGGRVVVCGAGPLALSVCERVALCGSAVTLLAPGGVMSSHLGAALVAELESAVKEAGIRLLRARLERVVGLERVEAVVAGGEVVPCSSVAIVPAPAPLAEGVNATRGRLGGILVDGTMRSSLRNIYAAGDCAELKVGSSSFSFMFESSAVIMGHVAGSNASGGTRTARVTGSFSGSFFGTEVAFAGLGLEDALLAGFRAREALGGGRAGGRPLCAVVYDSATHEVHGVQMVGIGSSKWAQAIAIIASLRLRLNELLSYDSPTGTDISPVAEAAREALRSA
jgi:NADPH-dependent 2,4-dienoyl-CoA reductase/sulfur reductase-like enzyme